MSPSAPEPLSTLRFIYKNMNDDLWKLDEVSAGEQRVLSEKEREFLATGDSGSYTNADMRRRVTKKANKLPDRFQQLIDDVSLLFYQDYLPLESEDAIYEDLLEISNRSTNVRDSPIARTASQQSDSSLDFGFEIGSLIRMVQRGIMSSEFIWGMIIGLIGEPSDEYERESKNLVELFDGLERHYEWRLVSAGTLSHQEGLPKEQQIIRQILHEEGLTPAPALIDAILREYTSEDSSDIIDSSEKLWQPDPEQAEHPQPPEEMPSVEEMQQTSFEMIISRLDEQTNLRSIDRLAKDLREDTIRIQQRDFRGAEADTALHYLFENEPVHIQNFKDTELKGQNNMSTALRRLSNEDSSWVNRPVTNETSGENTYWNLTTYGRLLYKVRVENNGSTNWMYEDIAEHSDSEMSLVESFVSAN
jgi:hypothetical protein